MKKMLLFLLTAVLLLQVRCAAADFSVGDKGQEVLEIKERLKDLRYITDGKLTKTYSKQTAESVRFFSHKAESLSRYSLLPMNFTRTLYHISR